MPSFPNASQPLTSEFTDDELETLRAELSSSSSARERFRHFVQGTVPCRVWVIRAVAGTLLLLVGAAAGAATLKLSETFPHGVAREDETPFAFVCHDGETNVLLDTACRRINEFNGAAGARRALTSVETAYSCLPHYRLHVNVAGEGSDSHIITFPYHAEVDLEKPDMQTTMAMLVLHGAMRDADNYFCLMYGLHSLQSYRRPEEVLVIAPDFNYENDEGVNPGDAFWNTSRPWGDWRGGAHSSPRSGYGRTVSSYEVVDAFVKQLAKKELFPNVDLISIVGHSAGGQTVQRYALTTKLPPVLRPGLDTRYIVANPSSYAYLDARRPVYSCGLCDCNSKECDCSGACKPDEEIHEVALPLDVPPKDFSREKPGNFVCGHQLYNSWPYGLANRWGYTAQQDINKSLALYAQRDVAYLVGQNDTCNDGLAVCDDECWQRDNPVEPCMRNHMDNRCPAMLTGPWRKVRGQQYTKYLQMFYGKAVHHFGIVNGSGHNATAMFESPTTLKYIYHKSHEEVADDTDLGTGAQPPGPFPYPHIVEAIAREPEEPFIVDE